MPELDKQQVIIELQNGIRVPAQLTMIGAPGQVMTLYGVHVEIDYLHLCMN